MSAAATSASLYWANVTLRELLDNSAVEDAADYKLTCDECAALISEDTYSTLDGLCEACHDACHFTCAECVGEFHQDDRSEYYPKLCAECGAAKRTEIADGLWSEIEDLAGSWVGEDYEIERLKKLLNYARRMK